jgi:hypothetical protein
MNFFNRGNKWSSVLLGLLLVVLITAAFLPILPDATCGRISYLTVLKNEWNRHQHKSAGALALVANCKK